MTRKPVFVSTWPFGVAACEVGAHMLLEGATALDAIEKAANITEGDPHVSSVGYGGVPNADGNVELDAAIMNGPGHSAGSVGAVTGTRRPISVARCVMERTPHVMLVGANADQFALGQGFPHEELLTQESHERWLAWQREQGKTDVAHFDVGPSNSPVPDDHDTIGLCALDQFGNLAAGCTTSGMAWKVPGRVGDSPIIGSGLYVDNEVGAVAGTGHGDEMMKACVSYRAVMLMEQGLTAQEACIESLRYLLRKRPPTDHGNYGAALIAIRKDGDFGAAATRSGFSPPDRLWNWAVFTEDKVVLREGVYITSDAVIPTLKS